MTRRWIDISVPLRVGMPVWPGDTALRIWRSRKLARDGVNVTELALGAHTGTHVDAPLHFVDGGAGVEALELDVLMGPSRLVTVDEEPEITGEGLQRAQIPTDCRRLLLRTMNRHHWGPESPHFREDFVALSVGAACWVRDSGIRLVGIDYLSIQPYHHQASEVHEILLEAGIIIVEGLDLAGLEDGDYDLACLPLLVPGADGVPARAVVRPFGPA